MAAEQVMRHCGHKPGVVRIGRLTIVHGMLRGSLYTKEMKSKQTEPLLQCLKTRPSVLYEAWPD